MYIYASNESPVNVFFDKLQVVHTRGRVLEENHYYAFGAEMPGLGSKAIGFGGNSDDRRKYNSNELQSKEFSDGSGLENYDFNARTYDPQVGRFLQIDPEIESEHFNATPYAFVYNNPISFSDPNGRDTLSPQQMRQMVENSRPAPDYTGVVQNATPQEYKENPVGAFIKDATHVVFEFLGLNAVDDATATYKNPNASTGDIVRASINLALSGAPGEGSPKHVNSPFPVENLKTTSGSETFIVTREGVVLPKGADIPKEFSENKYRSSSYGTSENGVWTEKIRIDPATPVNKKGPNVSHFHQDGGDENIFDTSRWLYWKK